MKNQTTILIMNKEKNLTNLFIGMLGSAFLFTPFVYVLFGIFGYEWKIWQITAVFIFLSLCLWGFVSESEEFERKYNKTRAEEIAKHIEKNLAKNNERNKI